jgi:integrase
MAVRGWTYKRCPHGITGTPRRGDTPAVKACRESHGSWYWRVEGDTDPTTGRRDRPSRGGYGTKDTAQEALSEQIDRMRRRVGVSDRGYTVKKWLEEWLRDGTWEPTTRKGYGDHVRLYLIPLLGGIRMRDLDRPAVAEALGKVATGDKRILRARDPERPGRGRHQSATHSPSTVDAVRRTLRSALTSAIEEGIIHVNPAVGRFKQIGKRARTARWWQPEDLLTFLGHVATDIDLCLWVVAAYTGLRRSELLGLRWEDVDLTSALPGVTIRQKVIQNNGPQLCPVCGKAHVGRQIRPGAKTAAGTERWVPLVADAVTELVAHQASQEALRQDISDHWTDHGLVFPETDTGMGPGSPRSPGDVTKRHGELVRASGAPKVVLHEMRHGAASYLHAAGLTMDQIALILGHSSGDVAKSVYVHAVRSKLHEAAQAAADLVQEDPGQSRG